jgi:hypothetical protein
MFSRAALALHLRSSVGPAVVVPLVYPAFLSTLAAALEHRCAMGVHDMSAVSLARDDLFRPHSTASMQKWYVLMHWRALLLLAKTTQVRSSRRACSVCAHSASARPHAAAKRRAAQRMQCDASYERAFEICFSPHLIILAARKFSAPRRARAACGQAWR